MPECNSCGTFVTPQFVRVFGDNESEVFGCPNCMPLSELTDGGGSRSAP